MKEHYYDKLFHIKTSGNQNDKNGPIHYHPYESTPYQALEILSERYSINDYDRVIDFGCGKGRLNFYLNYFHQATTIGVEMSQHYYQEAIKNFYRYREKHPATNTTIYFHRSLAESYPIHRLDNKFYFFNPFSIQIFMRVVHNILRSVEENNRQVEIILYYGSEDYMYFLENQTTFELVKEIQVPGKYEFDSKERFLIYRLAY